MQDKRESSFLKIKRIMYEMNICNKSMKQMLINHWLISGLFNEFIY